jgi:hypothetical protein
MPPKGAVRELGQGIVTACAAVGGWETPYSSEVRSKAWSIRMDEGAFLPP